MLMLCCLLWARPGQGDALVAYEDRVLALLPDHGAEVLERVRGNGLDGHPLEVQMYRFPSQASLDSYLNDPTRLALVDERDRVVERTEVFPVQRVETE